MYMPGAIVFIAVTNSDGCHAYTWGLARDIGASRRPGGKHNLYQTSCAVQCRYGSNLNDNNKILL